MVRDTRNERRYGSVSRAEQRYPESQAPDAASAVRDGVCPICGEGPFTVVAIHAQRKHGIDRRELRDLIGVPYNESICDPAHSASRREMSREQWEDGRTGIGAYAASSAGRNLSDAAKRMQKAKAAMISDDERRRVAREAGDARLALVADRDALIAQALRDADDLTFAAAAELFNVGLHTIKRVAAEAGLNGTERKSRRMKGTQPDSLKGRTRRPPT